MMGSAMDLMDQALHARQPRRTHLPHTKPTSVQWNPAVLHSSLFSVSSTYLAIKMKHRKISIRKKYSSGYFKKTQVPPCLPRS